MTWIIFALLAALSWGLYGPALHRGQVALGSPLRALLCVGIAYFLIGVLVPLVGLWYQGELGGFTMKGSMSATLGGALGAAGAICIIFAFKNGGVSPPAESLRSCGAGAICIIFAFKYGGLPPYGMPLVFGGAPLVNVLFSMWLHPPKLSPNPLLYLGFLLVSLGAGMVLFFKPQS